MIFFAYEGVHTAACNPGRSEPIINYIFVKSHHFTFDELVEGFEALDI